MWTNSAVVLAAGEGRRLRPLTKYRPKPMLPAANRPILEYVFDALIDAGIDDLHVVVGYERERVQEHFGPSYRDRTLTYHTQKKQLGSGHALLQAHAAIDGDFVVVNGDEVVTTDVIEGVIENHSAEDTCTLAVMESAEAAQYGAVRLDGETVTELVEKPGIGTYRLYNTGVYAFGPSFFSAVENVEREEGELALTDAIAEVIDRGGHVRGVVTGGEHSEVTYPWDLTSLATALLAGGRVDAPERAAGNYVADSATVAEAATLHPPVVIDEDVVVGPGAVVGPDTAVGRNATVEAGAVVRRSVIDADTRIGANATLVDSITGEGVEIGVGVTAPGGRADVTLGTTVHERERLGCVLADRATVGGGATITAGLLVGPGAVIDAGATVRRNVDEGAEVRS